MNTQQGNHFLLYVGIQMHRKKEMKVLVFVCQLKNCPANVFKALSKTFPAMGSDQNQFLLLWYDGRILFKVGCTVLIDLAQSHHQTVNHGIPYEEHFPFYMTSKVYCRLLGGCKM